MQKDLRNALLLIGLGLLLSLLAEPISRNLKKNIDPISRGSEFARILDLKSQAATDAIFKLQKEIKVKGVKIAHKDNQGFLQNLNSDGIGLSVFRNDELVLWSSQAVSPSITKQIALRGTEIAKIDNGWYRILYYTDGVDEFCAHILIKNEYPYQNEYLSNSFQRDFSQEALKNISLTPVKGSVKLKADRQPFYLIYNAQPEITLGRTFLYGFCLLLGLGFLISGLWKIFRLQTDKGQGVLGLSIFLLGLITVRYTLLRLGWPSFLSDIGFFSPRVYASSSLFSSLADLYLAVAFAAIISLALRRLILQSGSIGRSVGIWIGIIILLLALGLCLISSKILQGLVLDSSIPFSVYNILTLDIHSILSLIAVGVLFYSCVIIASTGLKAMDLNQIGSTKCLLVLSVLSLLFVLYSIFLSDTHPLHALWPLILLAILYVDNYYLQRFHIQLGKFIFLIIFFSSIASTSLIRSDEVREHRQREAFAEKLAVDDDPITELLFREVTSEVVKDRGVKNVFEENELHTRETLEDYVLSRYFTGYWSKYDIKLYAFNADSTVWGKLPNVRPKTFREISEEIDVFGEESEINEGLYYMYNTSNLVSYIAIVPLYYQLLENPDGFLIFEFSSKFFPEQIGFPSLLIDQSVSSNIGSSRYSSARYVNGELIRSRGSYPYKSHIGEFKPEYNGAQFAQTNDYNHLVRPVDESTVLIVSKEQIGWIERATTFSYLCLIFGILVALFSLGHAVANSQRIFDLNLNQKIQALLVVLSLVSLILFALATRYYIESNFSDKNRSQLAEKSQSVLIELKNKTSEEDQLNYDTSDLLNRMLSQFSYIFFTDINIYTPDGNLLASSQLRMFNEGLLSRTINPTAYLHLKHLDKVEFIHEEKVGSLDYISAYTPLYNKRGKLLAYVNLPYFAKQAELENELSSFLEAVINIFVLLFIISILIALTASQWITAPLRIIRSELAGVDLQKTNRMIAYSGSDEIGSLVNEYNAKVAELEHNAEILAQTQREVAWREMAKQVAHEIKNPLTPMKLSIQHLERTIQTGKKPDEKEVRRLAKNLIEQIDALTGIANAFSDFAKMPKSRKEKVNLVEVIDNSISLFDKFQHINLSFYNSESDPAMVLSDKDQLLRVMNNLLKNSIQATTETPDPKVEIKLLKEGGFFKIAISDNGPGIDEQVQDRIFVPNFTTKSRGMGLGLAISKNIVEQFGGKIWFETSEGLGTTFYFQLPTIN